MTEREARHIDRHRAESALSPDKRLSSFDFAAVPSVSQAQVTALADGHEWLERRANVLLFGPPGVGKSHLVCGLGHALIDAGRRVLFTRCSDLVQRPQAARRRAHAAEDNPPAHRTCLWTALAGAWAGHRSPADAYGLTRFACQPFEKENRQNHQAEPNHSNENFPASTGQDSCRRALGSVSH